MLLQGALFFVLGIAVTVFVLILLAPFIWQRMLFFVRKVMRSQLPVSMREIEADRNFLCAQHAVQMSRQQERYQLLQRINDEQRLYLQRNQEHLQRLHDLEGKNTDIEKEIIKYRANLNSEKQKVASIISAQGQSAKEVRDLYFSEKLVRVDIASYEKMLKKMEEKVELLAKKYNQLSQSIDDITKQEIHTN